MQGIRLTSSTKSAPTGLVQGVHGRGTKPPYAFQSLEVPASRGTMAMYYLISTGKANAPMT